MLNEWDVYLPVGLGALYNLEGANGMISIKKQQRKIKEADGMIKISGTKVRVGSGGISKVGLTRKQIESIEKAFRRANPTKRSVPDSAYLIKERNPILMLHVIEKKIEDDSNFNPRIPETLFALGIGLPGNGEVQTADYVVNQVELRNWMDIDEEDEDAFE